MNHPSQEEWISYLYGETSKESAQDLKAHLHVCPQCKAAVQNWKETMGDLNSWKLAVGAVSTAASRPFIKWGIAAAIFLGFGFGFGAVFGRSSPNMKSLGMALVPVVREQVRKELAADLLAALNPNSASLANDFSRELRAEFEQWKELTSAAAKLETEGVVANWSASNNSVRLEDRQAVLALLQKMEQQHRADYGALLKKLETVALVAEERLQRTQTQIGQLAAFTQAEGTGLR